jgi:hypothetical protein
MFGLEVAFGAAGARRFGGVGFWLALVLRGATRGVVSPRLANCRAEAEKPTIGGAGGGPGGGAMLLVDPVVCGANYYAESAAVIGGPPPKTCGFRFT